MNRFQQEWGSGASILEDGQRSLSKETIFEQRSCGKSVLDRGKGECKGPEAVACWVYLRTIKEQVTVAGAEGWQGKTADEKDRDVTGARSSQIKSFTQRWENLGGSSSIWCRLWHNPSGCWVEWRLSMGRRRKEDQWGGNGNVLAKKQCCLEPGL